MAEPVEKFKLSKELVGFSKAYRKLKKMHNVVSSGVMQKMKGLSTEQEKLRRLNFSLRYMLQNTPKDEQHPEGMEADSE